MATQLLNTPDQARPSPVTEPMLMDVPSQHPHQSANEITIGDLIDVLWGRKWLVLAAILAAAVVAYVAAQFTPKEYKASVTISPVTSTSSGGGLGGLGSITSEFSGLASLAGLSVAGDTRKYESLEVLRSEALTERFIAANDLLPVLYPDKWDAARKRWNVQDPRKVPTLWKANQLFKGRIRDISTDPKTGIVTLSITWKDARTAAAWANQLVGMTNAYLRDKAITESERNIAYLNQQAAKMEFVGAKQALYVILENEINKAMLARGSDEYAFKVLDPAFPPERPYSPRPLLWVLIAVAGVVLLSAFAALLALVRRPR
jgi:uncharacterized protein involved in exopolysaccharide biosynthesis